MRKSTANRMFICLSCPAVISAFLPTLFSTCNAVGRGFAWRGEESLARERWYQLKVSVDVLHLDIVSENGSGQSRGSVVE